MDPLELSLIRMVLEYPAMRSTVRESGVLEYFRTEELKPLGEALLAGEQKGRAMGDIPSLIASLTDGPLRERLLSLLVQESPYPEELIDRLISDTIRKIRERSNKEMDRILTRRIAEAEKSKNQALYDRLVAQKNQLLQKERGISSNRADLHKPSKQQTV
jgi:hypothetical protein